MATILAALERPARFALLSCSFLLLLSRSAPAEPGRPVAFYDGDAVLAHAAAMLGEDARLARLVARHAAETALLRREVDASRLELTHSVTLPAAQRREIEARLAHATIALLVAETEGAREIEAEEGRLAERLQQGVTGVVARVASERGLPVVVRAGSGTVVVDPGAVDVTDDVLAALGTPDTAPDVAPLPAAVRQRTRLQACAPPAGSGSLISLWKAEGY